MEYLGGRQLTQFFAEEIPQFPSMIILIYSETLTLSKPFCLPDSSESLKHPETLESQDLPHFIEKKNETWRQKDLPWGTDPNMGFLSGSAVKNPPVMQETQEMRV